MKTIHSAITWADLVKLKKNAKASKASLPGLTHSQRLDALAYQEFGVRHYHELQQRYQAHVASFIELAGAHHCRYCHLTFSDYDADDRKLHFARHQKFEEAEVAIGFLPLPFQMREDIKRDFGYEQLYRGDAAAKRMGALTIILSHYDRSLERAIENGRWHKHPSLLEYIPCALANSSFLHGDLLQHFITEFGEMRGVIVAGDTDWPAEIPCPAGWGSTKAAESRKLRDTILDASRSN